MINKVALMAIYEHNIDLQEKAEARIQEEYAAGNHTLQSPYIVVNPYLIAPLTALVMFHTDEIISATAVVQGKKENGNIYLQFPATKEHVLEIVGLYAGVENKVTITLENGESVIVIIKTEALPINVASATISTEYSAMDIWNGTLVFAIPTGADYLTAGYDCNGDCRWYTNQKFAYTMKRGNNGRILVGAPKLLAIPYSPTTMYEMSLSGKIYREFRLPRGYHHNYYEVDEKHIMFLTQNIELGTSGDLIVLFNTDSGEVEKEWDLKKMLPQDVAGSGSQDMHDWFHANSVWYDKDTDSITVSGRHQDIIVNFNASTETLNWMLGDSEQWPEEYVNSYFLKADGDIEWAYEPHAVQYIGEDMLLCFDSGHYRGKTKENYVSPEKNYSRAVIYQVNPKNKTVKQIWQYGKEMGMAFFSTYMGNISVYGKNYYGVHSGGSALVDGKAIDMPGIFRKDFDSSCELYSTTHEVCDQQCICKISYPTNTYQMERIAIQDKRDTHKWGKGKKVGEFAPTEEFPMDFPKETSGYIPTSYNLNFGYDGERLFIRADFLTAEMVMLKLEGEKENHTFYVQSTRRPFYTMCPVTWRPGNGRPVEWPITVKGFDDIFKLKVLINEKVYETGVLLDLRGGR